MPQPLYPFQTRTLDVGGAALSYVDEGQGRPVLMLHGNPTWSFYYRELIQSLRGTHRVIAPDHVGCGRSSRPGDYPYTLGRRIEDVTRLVEHLGLEDVTLVVHDWGGAIGMGWATRQPQRVRNVVVFNSAAFHFRRTPLRIAVCGLPLIGPLLVQGLNAFLRASFVMAVGRGRKLAPDVRAGYLEPYGSWRDRRAILEFVRDIPRTPRVPSHAVVREIEAGLARLADKPMMICWGDQDWCFDARALAGWMQRFPRAEVHRFAQAGHYVVEDAIEQIIPLVGEFVGRNCQLPITNCQ
jgi:haloalkane dehalogenase